MAGVRVVTDSSCDLPEAVAAELGIDIVPLSIRFGDEEFIDREELSADDFWARCARSPVLPETAAPSPGRFEEAFRRAADAGAEAILCLNLSGRLSGTIQAAQLASKAVENDVRVEVIDSRSITMGLGGMAATAARMASEGESLDRIVEHVNDMIPRTHVYGALDTLDNLKKGGRIGGAQAMIGSMLSIKPIIEVRDGVVESESKQRTRSRSLSYLVDKVRSFGAVENLAAMHGDAPDMDEFLDKLAELYPRDQIIVGEIGPVIGTHGGPRVVGITFQTPR